MYYQKQETDIRVDVLSKCAISGHNCVSSILPEKKKGAPI